MSAAGPPRLKIKAQVLLGDVIAIGPGKADLLDAISRTGSIAAAGRELGISYRRTRDMVDVLNRCWGVPLVETTRGGSDHGGAHLSPQGAAVLRAYRSLEAALNAAVTRAGSELLALVEPAHPPS